MQITMIDDYLEFGLQWNCDNEAVDSFESFLRVLGFYSTDISNWLALLTAAAAAAAAAAIESGLNKTPWHLSSQIALQRLF